MGKIQLQTTESASNHQFEMSGGALCLDFVNTLGDRPQSRSEHLHSFQDLLSWGRQAGILAGREERSLIAEAAERQKEARSALLGAKRFRESLYRIFSALAAAVPVRPEELARLKATYLDLLRRSELVQARQHFELSTSAASRDLLDTVLDPVIRSAWSLLFSEEARLVRECASECCSWIFVDRSRTHRRRWCDMKVCGNRAKARRHYQRKKAAATGASRTARK